MCAIAIDGGMDVQITLASEHLAPSEVAHHTCIFAIGGERAPDRHVLQGARQDAYQSCIVGVDLLCQSDTMSCSVQYSAVGI